MDRFSWSDNSLNSNEQILFVQKGVRLYNGPERTAFNKGKVTVTTHRLFWADSAKSTSVLSLPLSYSVFFEKESGGLTKSPKIKIHLSTKEEHQASGPFSQSLFSYIQLSFTEGGEEEFYRKLNEVVSDRKWEKVPTKPLGFASKSVHSGISGIERSLQLKKQNRDATISVAFEDLSNLMTKAQEMVSLSKNISAKFRDKQEGVTEDETLQFKSYLMSLGISDPITRDSHGTGGAYYEGLAREISQFIKAPLMDCGGVMTLTDVYCRMNRARGMELLSPEDLESACRLLEKLDLPVRMKEYENGVKVLQLHSCDEKMVAQETEQIIKENGHLSADELATLIGMSVVLAKQRLLVAERLGKLCRDESSEGIAFYPNLFLANA